MSIENRKLDHISLALEEGADRNKNYFDEYSFVHNALPEIDYKDIDTSTNFLGKKLSMPLIINSMTGGTKRGKGINMQLASIAEKHKIAFAVGSQRIMIENPNFNYGFQGIREIAPSIPILANLGAVQLNYGYGLEECKKIVNIIEADALCLHLNPLQEALQPEGDTNFFNILSKIENLVKKLSVPIIVKEVGCGISKEVANSLRKIGIKYIDVSGSGGTSWNYIETRRLKNSRLKNIFSDFGIPTPLSIKECSAVDEIYVIASGGVRSGLDIAKSVALGAKCTGMALPFLETVEESQEKTIELIENIQKELKISMFVTGSKTLEDLSSKILTTY